MNNRKTRLIFLIIILSILAITAMSQSDTTNWCASHEVLTKQLQSNLKLSKALEDLNSSDETNYLAKSSDITIPVVVHVVHKHTSENISDEQIKAQIEGLSLDLTAENWDIDKTPEEFSDIIGNVNIKFKLATKDPNGLPTNGITRTETKRPYFTIRDEVKHYSTGVPPWDTRRYLNIWVCDLIWALGYAQFPNGDVLTDGVVVDYKYFGTYDTINGNIMTYRVLTHEVGHWLGLYHIWGDEWCGNDNIKDTPKQDAPHHSCYESIETCKSYDLTVNYMDYVKSSCMVMFTEDQANRAWKTIKKYRKELDKPNNRLLTK